MNIIAPIYLPKKAMMSTLDILIIAIALAMDCFAVSITAGLMMEKPRFKTALIMAVFFGGFQGLMPVFGWFAGASFANLIDSFDHWIAFGLLACIGGNMIRESLSEKDEGHFDTTSYKVLFGLAVATSIDALIVGVNLGLMRNTLLSPSLTIAAVSFLLTIVGVYLGACFKRICRFNFELIGGIVLILIGLKILFEHLFAH